MPSVKGKIRDQVIGHMILAEINMKKVLYKQFYSKS